MEKIASIIFIFLFYIKAIAVLFFSVLVQPCFGELFYPDDDQRARIWPDAAETLFYSVPKDQDAIVSLNTYSQRNLDPARIGVLVWNVGKGNRNTGLWRAQLSKVVTAFDLLLFQESPSSDEVLAYFSTAWVGYGMTMAVSFIDHNGNEYGNTVVSIVKPSTFDFRRSEANDYIFGPKKLITFSTHPLEGMKEELLVVNIHALNLEANMITNPQYQRQLLMALSVLRTHKGPVIFGGDFNAWSPSRYTMMQNFMQDLGFQEVAFENEQDKIWPFFGRALDYVFFHGLVVKEAKVLKERGWEEASDHLPLSVYFRVDCTVFVYNQCSDEYYNMVKNL